MKKGLGEFSLSNANTFTGGTSIIDGNLILDDPAGNAIGTVGPIQFGNSTGTLVYGGNFASSFTNNFEIPDLANRLSGASGQVFRIFVPPAREAHFFADLDGAGNSFVKTGGGTLQLFGINGYDGSTTIQEGTVEVDGLLNSATNVDVSFLGSIDFL